MPLPFRDNQAALILLASCAVVHIISSSVFPHSSLLYPSAALGAAGLFFGGITLWPAVFIGILMGELLGHSSSPSLTYIISVAATAEAVLGAYMLRITRIDPLFRRYRDTAHLTLSALSAAALFTGSIVILRAITGNTLPDIRTAYLASVFCYLVIVPFFLRWYAKPSFRRSGKEAFETIGIMASIIAIDIVYFVFTIHEIFGLSLLYILIVPLFWTAIRLRPRFVTLSIVITSGFALFHALTEDPTGSLLPQAEWLMITLSLLFYIIVSLEEDRRVNTNLLRSQLSTLENAIARISSESRAKNDFIAILAHELRNPLAPVVSAIDHMRLTEGTQDPETLTVMEDSMNTVKRLLDDLLDVSRIAEGKISLKREPLLVSSVIRRALVSTEHYFVDRHQTVVFKELKRGLAVTADPVRLEQVFTNLLTNASKYSNPGTTTTIELKEASGKAEIRVHDEGIGIPKELLTTVFLPFHQIESGKRQKKGLGIGLALVQSFIEMHEGSVEVASSGPGKGSTFIVKLPLTQAPLVSKNADSALSSLPDGKKNILVVDDNDAAAAGIGRLLEHLGCRVQYAYTGKKGYEKGVKGNFDAIILDVGLPDRDGYTVARQLRKHGYGGMLIGLSGFSTPEAREQGKEAGFDTYLVKPAGLAELQRALHEER